MFNNPNPSLLQILELGGKVSLPNGLSLQGIGTPFGTRIDVDHPSAHALKEEIPLDEQNLTQTLQRFDCLSKNQIATDTAYAAVRLTEGKIWFNSDEIQPLREMVEEKTTKTNAQLPGWAKENPVQRIVKVQITEIT